MTSRLMNSPTGHNNLPGEGVAKLLTFDAFLSNVGHSPSQNAFAFVVQTPAVVNRRRAILFLLARV
jgi:hypothetical protein